MNSENKRPTHIIWQITGERDKARWTKVGVGWTNRDSKGITIKFDAYPLTGRTVMREFRETENASNGDER